MNKFNYKYLTPFKWFVIENFPFIEADFDAITEWQLFEKLGNEINKIINSQNQVGSEMEILSNAFIELQNYVNNYLDNLDIQEEVNNKLNEMAESGQLSEIIAQYLQLQGLLCYNTKAELKNAENLENGSFTKTFGTNEYNDGYGNLYKIRTLLNTDIIDDENILALINYPTLIAEKIPNNYITDIQSDITDIEEDIEELKNKKIDTRLLQNLIGCKNIAHRGANYEAPENTIPAFIWAGKQKFYGCECDVQETSDGYFVIMHDETVDRMTNGSGTISQMTLAQIQALTIDAGNNIANYSNLKVPTLQEYIEVCKYYGLVPVIELKTVTNLQAFYDILKDYQIENRCIIISFSTSKLETLKQIDNTLNIQALVNLTAENIAYCVENGFDIDTDESYVTKELVDLAHENGLLVNCWTPTTTSRGGNLVNMGIDFITINELIVASNTEKPYTEINGCQLYNEYEALKVNSVKMANIVSPFLKRAQRTITPANSIYEQYNSPSSTRGVSMQVFRMRNTSSFSYNVPSGYRITVHPYKADGTQNGDKGWLTGSGSVSSFNSGTSFGFVYGSRTDNGNLNEYDLQKLEEAITGFTY